MILVLLLIHLLTALALLGAITHQAFSVGRRKPKASGSSQHIVDRFRGVHSPAFTNVIVLLFFVTFIVGGLLYPRYRIDVRPTLEDLQLRAANGIFEAKEHFAAVGLGLLPAYWLFWRPPLVLEYAATRKYLTWILAFVVWWNFLVGEVLNNIRGLFP
jgi:hypothetical protein